MRRNREIQLPLAPLWPEHESQTEVVQGPAQGRPADLLLRPGGRSWTALGQPIPSRMGTTQASLPPHCYMIDNCRGPSLA